MAEEHRCQAPKLCANNCGFFGSPATQNLCSKCYRDLELKEQQSSSAKLALNQSLVATSTSSSSSSTIHVVANHHHHQQQQQQREEENEIKAAEAEETSAATAAVVAANRCVTCRRRVGLTGFKCRCGMTCCGTHRYPEQHGCSFDFKGMGREQIAKANPVIKAEKLDKI